MNLAFVLVQQHNELQRAIDLMIHALSVYQAQLGPQHALTQQLAGFLKPLNDQYQSVEKKEK